MNSSNTVSLYPLKFKPLLKEKLWGGHKIGAVLGKDISALENCGELWAISGVDGDISVVEDGPLKGHDIKQLINQYQGKLLGHKVFEKFGETFPLLIKFIDANQDLSIQVHPDDQLAKTRHNSFGKTEMWYIIQADEGAKLVSGFNRAIDKDTYLKHFNEGSLMEILNQENVVADDAFFIPAGRVHTIGKGLLLAEIQQTSDITYRIYDFDRTDSNGNKRELHTEQALDAIDYNFYDQYKVSYQTQPNQPSEIASCPYFFTNRIDVNTTVQRNLSGLDSFVVYIGIDGSAAMNYEGGKLNINKGEAVLVPAEIQSLTIQPEPEAKLLETYIP